MTALDEIAAAQRTGWLVQLALIAPWAGVWPVRQWLLHAGRSSTTGWCACLLGVFVRFDRCGGDGCNEVRVCLGL